MLARRLEEKLSVALPVKVFVDAGGLSPEWSCTYEIAARGARLLRTPKVTKVGQEIWLQRNNRRAKFRVTWIGEPDSPNAQQFGAESTEDRMIWDDELQGKLRR